MALARRAFATFETEFQLMLDVEEFVTVASRSTLEDARSTGDVHALAPVLTLGDGRFRRWAWAQSKILRTRRRLNNRLLDDPHWAQLWEYVQAHDPTLAREPGAPARPRRAAAKP